MLLNINHHNTQMEDNIIAFNLQIRIHITDFYITQFLTGKVSKKPWLLDEYIRYVLHWVLQYIKTRLDAKFACTLQTGCGNSMLVLLVKLVAIMLVLYCSKPPNFFKNFFSLSSQLLGHCICINEIPCARLISVCIRRICGKHYKAL